MIQVDVELKRIQTFLFSITRLKPPASSRLASADKIVYFGVCHGLQVWQSYGFLNWVSLCLGDKIPLQNFDRGCCRTSSSHGSSKMREKLALKAQSQCRATLETLAAIKNPPVIFVKQANGHQQVNNGVAASHTAEKQNQQNERKRSVPLLWKEGLGEI